MKSLLSALKSSGKKKTASKSKLRQDENSDLSPLAPRRLLSATPEGRAPLGQAGQQLRAGTVSFLRAVYLRSAEYWLLHTSLW